MQFIVEPEDDSQQRHDDDEGPGVVSHPLPVMMTSRASVAFRWRGPWWRSY
jgi:hypothetical protein